MVTTCNKFISVTFSANFVVVIRVLLSDPMPTGNLFVFSFAGLGIFSHISIPVIIDCIFLSYTRTVYCWNPSSHFSVWRFLYLLDGLIRSTVLDLYRARSCVFDRLKNQLTTACYTHWISIDCLEKKEINITLMKPSVLYSRFRILWNTMVQEK